MKKFITAVTIVLMMSFGLTTFGCTVQDNTSSSSQQLHSTQSSQSLSTNSDSSVESSSSLSSSSQELSTTESSQSSTESLDSSVESSSSSSSILSSTSPSSSSSSSSQSSSSIKQFTIAFQNGEQTIWTTQVEQGQEVVYGGETPTKQADAQYTYEFIGWQTEDGFLVPTLLPAYQDMVYYAKYSHTLNSYKIILRDGENILKEDKLSYGEQIVYDGELTKPSTKEYEYNFVGWSLSENGEPVQLGVVTGEATYWAIYTQTARKYDIKFVIDGQEQVEKFGYGEDIIYSQTPVKQATEEYLYEFVGWSLTENGEIVQLGQVQGEQTYYAVFNPVKNRFTVSWNIDGKVSTNYVTKGSSPVYNGQTPTKGEVGKIYTFEGWSLTEGGEIVDLTTLQITQDETYYAVFSYEVETFTITWDVEGVLTTQTYNYGQTLFWDNQTPTKPSTLDIQFTFKGWSKTQNGEVLDLNEVMACNDMTLYAVFEGKIIDLDLDAELDTEENE